MPACSLTRRTGLHASGVAWSVEKNTVIRSAFGMFYSAEANIFDDLGLNPPQLTFYAANFNAGTIPSAAQLISSGFPSCFASGQRHEYQRPGQDHGPVRLIPHILEWNLSVQHQFAAKLGGPDRLRRHPLLPSMESRGQ